MSSENENRRSGTSRRDSGQRNPREAAMVVPGNVKLGSCLPDWDMLMNIA